MVAQMVKNFHLTHGTGKVLNVFTKAMASFCILAQINPAHTFTLCFLVTIHLTWSVCRYLQRSIFLYDIYTVVVLDFLFFSCIKHVSVSDHSNNILCTLQIMELIALYSLPY
jgi:hypothetical protein